MSVGRVVLITGASSGNGQRTMQALSEQGYTVFGTSRSPSADGGQSQASLLPLDVGSDASVQHCVETVLAQAGRIDVLINNAGYLLAGAIEDATLDQVRAQFETNFFGVVRMVKAVLPSMRRQGGGQIVTISSLAGLVPVPFWGFYNASKFAVEGYCETLRYELAPINIHVSLVEPGAIKTDFAGRQHVGSAPVADYSPQRERVFQTMHDFNERAPGGEVVAQTVVRILASRAPALRYPVTREAVLFLLLRRWLPAGAYERVVRLAFKLDRA